MSSQNFTPLQFVKARRLLNIEVEANACLQRYDLAGAARHYTAMIEGVEAILGTDHIFLAQLHNKLGEIYSEAGKPGAADCFRRALDIAKQNLSSGDPAIAVYVSNLGGIYRKMGQPRKAREEFYFKAGRIERAAYGVNHSAYAATANNIGATHADEYKNNRLATSLSKAKHWQAIALRVDKEKNGERHHIVAHDYMNWAILLHAEGDLAGAEKFSRDALRILETYWPQQTLMIAQAKIGLADMIRHTNPEEAGRLYQEALDADRNALGDHIDVASDLQRLAHLEASQGNYEEAMSLFKEALPIQTRFIRSGLSVVSETGRLAFLTYPRIVLDHMLTIALTRPDVRPDVYRQVLSLKGMHVHVDTLQREDALLSGQPSAQGVFGDLRQAREELSTLLFTGNRSDDVRKAEEECERLERELARQLPAIELERRLDAVDICSVAQSLPAGTVLVDFVQFTPANFDAPDTVTRSHASRYVAFVLPAGQPESLQMIDLGSAERIDALVAEFRLLMSWPIVNELLDSESISDDERAGFNDLADQSPQKNQESLCCSGSKLYTLVFEPVVRSLGAAMSERLIISPDGELNLLPFAALVDNEGKFLVEQFCLSYVTSGRDILRFGQQSGKPNPALIIANPNFDFCEPCQQSPQDVSDYQRWEAVDATQETAEEVYRHLQSHDVPVGNRWYGDEVLKSRLKSVFAPVIFHAGTHGLCTEDNSSYHNPIPLNSEDPLIHSGIVLAGYHTFLRTGRPGNLSGDGLWTARDVCGANLHGTELVVMAACKTGVGRRYQGEGIFGLRSAFHQAGAKTVVMSLLTVFAEDTHVLMRQFYRNLLPDSQNSDPLPALQKPDALRNAQRYIIEEMHDGRHREGWNGFAHPFYWAAFICQGDPAPFFLPPSVGEQLTGTAVVRQRVSRWLWFLARFGSSMSGATMCAYIGSKIMVLSHNAQGAAVTSDLRYGSAALGGTLGWILGPLLAVNLASLVSTFTQHFTRRSNRMALLTAYFFFAVLGLLGVVSFVPLFSILASTKHPSGASMIVFVVMLHFFASCAEPYVRRQFGNGMIFPDAYWPGEDNPVQP